MSMPCKMLYLIDTRNGNQQIVSKHDIAAFYSDEWKETVAYGIEWFGEVLFQDQIVVMTYAKFGVLAERYPRFGYDFELILCDEIHSLPKFCNIPAKRGDKNYHIMAKRRLEDIINGSQVTVVGLSATPQKAEEQLCCPIRHITVDDDVRQLEVKKIIPYETRENIDCRIHKNEKMPHNVGYSGRHGRISVCSMNADNHKTHEW